jgi:hydrogenase expression/formation protein HypE
MRRLIRQRLLPAVENEFLGCLGDAAQLSEMHGRVAMTTDSFVVSPLFFPGGDIGSLAVYGTVNDLAVTGAIPQWISLALIIEEGLTVELLQCVIDSLAAAARRVGVQIVTGDTKVVPRGAADQLFINTAGIGLLSPDAPPGPATLQPGDQILVSGPIARHGIAVMACREGLQFDPPPTSDSAPLVDVVTALREARIPVRAMRDATRGGLAAVMHEWAETSQLTMALEETQIPLTNEVQGACELLGLDPVHVACEGTMVVAVPQEHASRSLSVMQQVPESVGAARVGEVRAQRLSPVVVRRALGQELALDEPVGAPLPRIC